MRTHLLGLPACRRPVIVEQGPQFNSTQIINFGNIVPDCGYSYDNCFRTGFWNTAGSIVGGMLAGLLFGGCLKGGRGGEKVEKPSTETTDTTPKAQEDKDIPKISELIDKLSAVKATPDEKSAKELYNTLKTLSEKPIDDVNKDHNIKYYKHLLEDLESFAKEKGWKLGDASDTNEVKPNGNNATELGSEWGDSELNSLSEEQKKKLAEAGIKPQKVNGKTCLTLPSKLTKANLNLLKSSGVPVAVQINEKAKDIWIAGNIDDIEGDKDDEIASSFKIDCKNFPGARYGVKYQVKKTTTENQFTIEVDTEGKSKDEYIKKYNEDSSHSNKIKDFATRTVTFNGNKLVNNDKCVVWTYNAG